MIDMRRHKRFLTARRLLCLIVAFASGVGCSRHDRPAGGAASTAPPGVLVFGDQLRPGQFRDFNLVLFTIDTVRRDHLGCYGMADAQTPTIDGLAGRGAVFEHAVAGQPSTLPSHCTIMTGLDVPNHGVRDNGKYVLDQNAVTLAEVLKQHGYATAATIATHVLNRRFGLNQGFDVYEDRISSKGWRPGGGTDLSKDADVVTDASIAWLTDHLEQTPGGRFFMWVHYFDAHLPYEPPEQFAQLFPDRPYDGEIAFLDHEMGRFLDFVAQRGLTERTLVVLASDHGEGLGEHGEDAHSRLVYDTTIRIPLIISCPPFFDAPRRVDQVTVGTIDIMPTILSLLGINAGLDMDGLDMVATPVPPDRAMYVETLAGLLRHNWAPLHGLRRIDAKYIQAPLPEYYRLTDDPHELDNVLQRDPRVADELAAQLKSLMDRWEQSERAAAGPRPLDAATARQLASLGYVTTADPSDPEPPQRPDPKDMVPIFEWIRHNPPAELHHRARELVVQAGRTDYLYRRGLILAETAHEKMPDEPAFLTTVGVGHFRLGRFETAVDVLAAAEKLCMARGAAPDPLNEAVAAMALHRLGRAEDAERRWRGIGTDADHDGDTTRILKEAADLLGDS